MLAMTFFGGKFRFSTRGNEVERVEKKIVLFCENLLLVQKQDGEES